MENASKALIIVSGALIGIMILTLAVYLIVTFGQTASNVNNDIRNNQVAQFNSQFLKYEGKNDVTIHDILTVANLARDNNIRYEIDYANRSVNNYYINVQVQNNSGTDPNIETHPENYFNNVDNKLSYEYVTDADGAATLRKYRCRVSISNVTGRVYEVIFSEV